MLVTADREQAAAAYSLIALKDQLPGYQAHLAPVQKGLMVVRTTRDLAPWVLVGAGGAPTPESTRRAVTQPTRHSRPLFLTPVGERPAIDQRPLTIPDVATGTILYGLDERPRRLASVRVRGGGEGDIYFTDTGEVCKIYKRGKATAATERKLRVMVQNQLGHPQIRWPTDLALTKGREFAGYFMPRAPGRTLIEAVTDADGLRSTFPQWTRADLADLAGRICDVVAYLHWHNVILGDLNDGNILVGADAVPWFIDTDSYQIGQFPSPVARLPFVHPDLMGGAGVNKVFRRVAHDRFALAALIFKILFIGSSPYLGAPEFEEQDHRDRVFQFRKKAEGDPRIRKDAALGDAPFIWSQLPFYLRDAFWKVFREYKEDQLDAREWQDLLRRYAKDLRREPNDRRRASTDLFPTRLKDPPPPGPGYERRDCAHCGHPLNAIIGSRTRYCVTCARKIVAKPCEVPACRREVYVPLLELNSPRRQKICNFHQKIQNR